MPSEATAAPMTKDEQIEYWMDRCFKAEDERAVLINHLRAIKRVVDDPTESRDDG